MDFDKINNTRKRVSMGSRSSRIPALSSNAKVRGVTINMPGAGFDVKQCYQYYEIPEGKHVTCETGCVVEIPFCEKNSYRLHARDRVQSRILKLARGGTVYGPAFVRWFGNGDINFERLISIRWGIAFTICTLFLPVGIFMSFNAGFDNPLPFFLGILITSLLAGAMIFLYQGASIDVRRGMDDIPPMVCDIVPADLRKLGVPTDEIRLSPRKYYGNTKYTEENRVYP